MQVTGTAVGTVEHRTSSCSSYAVHVPMSIDACAAWIIIKLIDLSKPEVLYLYIYIKKIKINCELQLFGRLCIGSQLLVSVCFQYA